MEPMKREVREILAELFPQFEFQFSFLPIQIIPGKTPNGAIHYAFTEDMSESVIGKVVVSEGAVNLLKTKRGQTELRGVLAHEVGHFALKQVPLDLDPKIGAVVIVRSPKGVVIRQLSKEEVQ